MGMRETVGSIRAYFILVGLGAGVSGGLGLWRAMQAPSAEIPTWLVLLIYAMPIVTMAVGLAFLFAGFTVKKQFAEGEPRQIQKIILFSGVVYVLAGLVRVALIMSFVPESRGLSGEVVGVAVGLVITWYLYTNSRRLAGESLEKRKEEARKTFE